MPFRCRPPPRTRRDRGPSPARLQRHLEQPRRRGPGGRGQRARRTATSSPATSSRSSTATPTTTAQALVNDIHGHRPGDVVKLTVQPPSGAARAETIKLGNFSSAASGRARRLLWIRRDRHRHQAGGQPARQCHENRPGQRRRSLGRPGVHAGRDRRPVQRRPDRRAEGGGDRDDRGDGNVGDVGGVPQKTVAVRRSGAVAFLVPPGEYKTALHKKAGSKLKVIPVSDARRRPQPLCLSRGRRSRPAATPDVDLDGRAGCLNSFASRRRPTWSPTLGYGERSIPD